MLRSGAELVPATDSLTNQFPRFRVLVIGKSGVGKSALINAVFGVKDATAVSHKVAGKHDINQEITFPSNDRLVLHDSQGFEAGEADNLNIVLNFIKRRRNASSLADRLHAIWVCAQIPHSGSRLFEAGVEKILKQSHDIDVPILVVFTKLDLLHKKVSRKKQGLNGEQLNMEVDAKVQKLCVEPLNQISPKCQWVATSSTSSKMKGTIRALVEKVQELEKGFELGVRHDPERDNIRPGHGGLPPADSRADSLDAPVHEQPQFTEEEFRSIGLAMAQRTSAAASIDACVRVGQKYYWRGLLSNIFFGFSMNKLIDILRRDIVNIWNMEDPEEHLFRPEFSTLLLTLIEDIVDKSDKDYQRTKEAIDALIANPLSLPITAPVAGVCMFTEWILNSYNQTKNSLRCMIALIVDLTLTMDILFYLVQSGGPRPLTRSLISQGLVQYRIDKKDYVHASIRAWTDQWENFSHIGPEGTVNMIMNLLRENRTDPNAAKGDGREVDEDLWITPDKLL